MVAHDEILLVPLKLLDQPGLFPRVFVAGAVSLLDGNPKWMANLLPLPGDVILFLHVAGEFVGFLD